MGDLEEKNKERVRAILATDEPYARGSSRERHYQPVSQVAEGDKVVTIVEVTLKHTGPLSAIAPAGEEVHSYQVFIHRLDDGKITGVWSYGDLHRGSPTGWMIPGLLKNALPLVKRALAITEATRGPNHVSTLIRLGDLAATYRDLGRPADALPLEERSGRVYQEPRPSPWD